MLRHQSGRLRLGTVDSTLRVFKPLLSLVCPDLEMEYAPILIALFFFGSPLESQNTQADRFRPILRFAWP
jgi:hypothetical protein